MRKECSFEDFAAQYSRVFVDDMPDSELDPPELTSYGDVNEKAELTVRAPSEEDRKYGWMDIPVFRAWLAAWLAARTAADPSREPGP